MEKEKASILNSSISSLEKEDLLMRILGKVISDKHSLALWKMPGQSDSRLFIDFHSNRKFEIEALEELSPGFIFAPFAGEKNLYIQGDLHIAFNEETVKLDPFSLNSDSLNWLEKAITHNEKINLGTNPRGDSTSIDEYKRWVTNGVEEINQGNFKKVVPARRFLSHWQGNPVDIFFELSSKYPNAFVSLTYTPTSGSWIGASPELLLSVDKNKVFTTASLAGTKPFDEQVELHNVTWTQKEIEEQAMVSRYIINCFKTIRLREFEEEGPMTVKAGNLVHLKTNFKVDMNNTNFPNLGSTMLRLLHPTSAVCGMPKDAATNFLKATENFDREFFSGYLGPSNVDGATNIFVNIRCARLFNNEAVIFAGAGVTSYSKADSEWKETELKCKTLLDVMI